MVDTATTVGLCLTLFGWAIWVLFTLRYPTPLWPFKIVAIEGIVVVMCALQLALLIGTMMFQWPCFDLMEFAAFRWPFVTAIGIAGILFWGAPATRAFLYMPILCGQAMLCYATLHQMLGAV